MLQTSLIDDIEEEELTDEKEANVSVNAFIDTETKNILSSKNTYETLEKVLENGFPSSNNWQSLANDLIEITADPDSHKSSTSTVMKRN